MLILYGTQTGNAKYVAEDIGRECTRRSIKARVSSMDAYDITQLPTEKIVIFVIATTGQGDPTSTMKISWKFLTRKDLPKGSLSDVNFTVFGLGDSSYEIFWAMARKLYQRMLQLGANCFHERALGDDQHDFGYEAEYDPWLNSLWDSLYKIDPSLEPSSIKPEESIEDSIYNVQVFKSSEISSLSEPDLKFYNESIKSKTTLDFYPDPLDVKSSKLYGSMKVNDTITSEEVFKSEDKETRHVELIFPENTVNYNPGDVCCVVPRNDVEIVKNFLQEQGLDPDDLLKITINQDAVSSSVPMHFPPLIRADELFEYWLDTCGVPNRYFFKVLAYYTDDEVRKPKLLELWSKTSEGKNEYYRYCYRQKRTYVEILYDFSTTKLPLEYMIQLIGPQKPREFSIASSLLVHPNSVHLTMGVLRYSTNVLKLDDNTTFGQKRLKEGICSTYISKLPVSPDSKVLWYVKSGTFPIPEDLSIPLILVAAGTGVAPFRSIIQDRITKIRQSEEMKQEDPDIILFYGCRNDSDDDYYSQEWEDYYPNLQVIKAFSRATDSKVYAQHKIKENKELCKTYLFDKGALVFVAGHSKFMPKSVEKALIETIKDVEGLDHKKFIKSRYTVEAW